MLKAIKKKLGKKLGHGSAPSLQEAGAAAPGEHAQVMKTSAPAGAEPPGAATPPQPAAGASPAAAEAQQQQQQQQQLAEVAEQAAPVAPGQQELLPPQQGMAAAAPSAGASPPQTEAQQREQAAAAAAAFSEPGPLPLEALDYTHDAALDDCDFGAGPLELGDDGEGEAARASPSHGYHPAEAGELLYGDSEPSASDGDNSRHDGGGGGGGGAAFNAGAAEDGGGEGYAFGGQDGGSGHACEDGSAHLEQLPGQTPPSQPSSPNGGDGEEDYDHEHGQGHHSASSGSELSPTADAAAAAAAAAGGGGGEVPVSDALAAMVYLTEEEEAGGGCDALSVLSDGLTEEELAEELSELEQALSALEGEALGGTSPGGLPSPGGPGSGLYPEMAGRLGLLAPDDDSSDPTVYAKQMVKLYTSLGLKLMDAKKHDESLAMMRKAEALVENDAMWGPPAGGGAAGTAAAGGAAAAHAAAKRKRLQAITYNNIGCLFKRRNQPQVALQYLTKALALEDEIGHVQNSSSTHLNICAAFSSLKRYKEALAHAERAILLLQRQLWAPTATFQDGLLQLTKVLSTAADKKLLSGVNVLAIAYHNAALEHERLGRLREAHVSFSRAATIASKCLGPRAAITGALQKALKAFAARHQQQHSRGRGSAVGTPRAGAQSSSQVKVRQTSPKRSTRVGSARPPSGSRTASRSALAASTAKSTLPLDKGSRSFGGSHARSGSSSKLSSRV